MTKVMKYFHFLFGIPSLSRAMLICANNHRHFLSCIFLQIGHIVCMGGRGIGTKEDGDDEEERDGVEDFKLLPRLS